MINIFPFKLESSNLAHNYIYTNKMHPEMMKLFETEHI